MERQRERKKNQGYIKRYIENSNERKDRWEEK